MEAGKLRHRIEIQSAVEARDSHGGVDYAWSTAATRWGSIEPLSGRELFAAQQIEAQVDVRVRLRHYDGLEPAMRLKHGTDIYEIRAVVNRDVRDIEQEVLCTRTEV